MFLIPLSQVESVELVIHALRMAGGEADCSSCPVRKVCMKQCLTIADAVSRMVADGTLPTVGEPESVTEATAEVEKTKEEAPKGSEKPTLKVIK